MGVCDLSNIDKDLLSRKHHFYGIEAHNLVNNVCSILGGKDPTKPVFFYCEALET
jgi:hypothetical protein